MKKTKVYIAGAMTGLPDTLTDKEARGYIKGHEAALEYIRGCQKNNFEF